MLGVDSVHFSSYSGRETEWRCASEDTDYTMYSFTLLSHCSHAQKL
jgi:hypothetical protein